MLFRSGGGADAANMSLVSWLEIRSAQAGMRSRERERERERDGFLAAKGEEFVELVAIAPTRNGGGGNGVMEQRRRLDI